MGLFKTIAEPEAVRPTVVSKSPAIEGWSESELVAVYRAVPVRQLKKSEQVFAEASHTDSFYVLMDGSVQVIATLHLAHILEKHLYAEAIDPAFTIYTHEYMSALGFSYGSPAELLRDRVIPSLMKNRYGIPEQIRNLVSNCSGSQ